MGGRNIKVASSVRFFAVLAGREHNDADAVGIPGSLLAGILGSLNGKGGAQPFHAAEFPLLPALDRACRAAHQRGANDAMYSITESTNAVTSLNCLESLGVVESRTPLAGR